MELKLKNMRENFIENVLLIVPYGIETDCGISYKYLAKPFNRTLWN